MRNFGAIPCTIASGCRSIAFAHRSITSACRSIASAFEYSRWIFILFTKEQGLYINKVLASGREKGLSGVYHTKWLEVYPLSAIARIGKRQ